MVADFYTKPLQGNLFWIFRDVILGYVDVSSLNNLGMETSDKERIGEKGAGEKEERKGEEEKAVITSDVPNPKGNQGKVTTWADIVSRASKG